MTGFSNPNHPIWALASRAIENLPALIVMLCTIHTWDTEFLLVASIIAGREGSRGMEKLLKSHAGET